MGVQGVPEPFQNAVRLELVKQGASMIDVRRNLGANWEGFGGLRLRHEPSSLSQKRLSRRFEASGSLKYHFGHFLEAKWYHFGSILDEFWVRVGMILDAPSKARWRNARARALDISTNRPWDHHARYPYGVSDLQFVNL